MQNNVADAPLLNEDDNDDRSHTDDEDWNLRLKKVACANVKNIFY